MKKKDIDTLVTYYKNLGKMIRTGLMEHMTIDGQRVFEMSPQMKRSIEIERLRIINHLVGYIHFKDDFGVMYLPKYKALTD